MDRLQKSQRRNQKLQEQKEELQNSLKTSRELLEYQQRLSFERLKSVEEKYHCIKQINVGLEVKYIMYVVFCYLDFVFG
jgi:hypothetical protein